jgi:hypothetical protein
LKKAVKTSLLELQRVVGDDEKVTATPLFKLYVELENNALCFKPTTDYLIQMFRNTMTYMTDLLKDFKRMEVVMYDERRRRLDEMRILREKEIKNNPALQRKGDTLFAMNMEEPAAKENYFENKIANDSDVKKYTNKTLENLRKWCEDLERGSMTDPWKRMIFYWSNPNQKDKFVEQFMKPGDDIHNIKSFIEKVEIEQ